MINIESKLHSYELKQPMNEPSHVLWLLSVVVKT